MLEMPVGDVIGCSSVLDFSLDVRDRCIGVKRDCLVYTRECSTPVAPAYSKRYQDMKSSRFQGAFCVYGWKMIR